MAVRRAHMRALEGRKGGSARSLAAHFLGGAALALMLFTALADPAYQQKLIDSGFEASPDTTPEKFRRRLEADVVFWTPVVEALGLKIY